MKFRIVLEFDPYTNSYSAVCPELPGRCSAGVTEAEARGNIEEAIRLYLAPVESRFAGLGETFRGYDWVIAAPHG